jgi:hypothetical protein
MAKGHTAALIVGVDLVFDPATPFGVGQRDALGVRQARIVFGSKVLDVVNPAIAITLFR